jgi:hypothetical protein
MVPSTGAADEGPAPANMPLFLRAEPDAVCFPETFRLSSSKWMVALLSGRQLRQCQIMISSASAASAGLGAGAGASAGASASAGSCCC